MNGPVALGLALILAGLLALDFWAQDGAGLIFLGRKLVDLIEYLAFWR